jgi:hypothetical protein
MKVWHSKRWRCGQEKSKTTRKGRSLTLQEDLTRRQEDMMQEKIIACLSTTSEQVDEQPAID